MPGLLDNYGNGRMDTYGMGNYNMPIHSQIIKVNGEAGARNLRLAPNSSILLLDENQPILWYIQTDGAGYSTVLPYDIAPHKVAPQVDLNQLENRLKKVEEMLNEQSNFRNAKSAKKQQQQQSAAE